MKRLVIDCWRIMPFEAVYAADETEAMIAFSDHDEFDETWICADTAQVFVRAVEYNAPLLYPWHRRMGRTYVYGDVDLQADAIRRLAVAGVTATPAIVPERSLTLAKHG